MEIPATTIGRYRAEIEAVGGATKAELKALGFESVEEAVSSVKRSIAVRLKISLDELETHIAALKKSNPGMGKREADKNTRDALVTELQDVLAVLNLASSETILTDEEKIRAFDALADAAFILEAHLYSAFGEGGMVTIWNPASKGHDNGLAAYVAGYMRDGKLQVQHAPKKLPVSDMEGYRKDSLEVKVFNPAPSDK